MNNIVYFVDKYTPEYENMLYMASKSAKLKMPSVRTVLQVHQDCYKQYFESGRLSIDKFVIFVDKHTPYANTRCYANLLMGHSNNLFVDIDTLFANSVEHIFKDMENIGQGNEIVIVTSRWPASHRPDLKFNFGVTFCNTPRFWNMCINGYNAANTKGYQSDDGELVPNQVYRYLVDNDESMYLIAQSGEFYNHIVEKADQNIDKASILHFKGERKKFMPHFFKKLGYDVASL